MQMNYFITSKARSIVILLTSLLLLSTSKSIAEWYGQYKKEITIDHSKVSDDLTSFPVLIDITDSDLQSKAQSDGDDIVFTSDNGITQLDHEIEAYDSSTGHLVVWVRVPSLSSTSDTILYMYYGNPSASNQENPTGVWDAHYVMVQHLEEASGTLHDSTSHDNDGTNTGAVFTSSGRRDGAYAFNGNDHISVDSSMLTERAFTISFWEYSSSSASDKIGYMVSDSGNFDNLFYRRYNQGTECGGGIGYINYATFPLSRDTWHFHTIIHHSDGSFHVYVDTVVRKNGTGSSFNGLTTNFNIANRQDLERDFEGTLDEVRVSDTARSIDWMQTEYNNQSNPSTFYSVGMEEEVIPPEAPELYDESPHDRATGVALNPTLSVDVIDYQSDLMDITFETDASGSWQVIKTYTNVGNGTYTATTTNMNNYNTTYNWRVSADDGNGHVTIETYSFTTRPENYAPTITDESPEDGATGVKLNPILSVYIEDLDGDIMDITFETDADGSWEVIESFSAVGTGTYTAHPTNMNEYNTLYNWRVTADDGTVAPVVETYSFTTKETWIITPKYTITNGGSHNRDYRVVDVNGDGIRDIVRPGSGTIKAFNGINGALLWSHSDSIAGDAQVEVADLNNDGILEVLVTLAAGQGGLLVVHGNNGQTYWRRTDLGGIDMSATPIVFDDDKDGYPDVYTVSRRMDGDYDGSKLCKLSYDGQIIDCINRVYWVCWGGLSLMDYNNDGRFELYFGDNGDPILGGGDVIKSFNADDLSVNWVVRPRTSPPTLDASANLPQLIDVTGDGVRDLVIVTRSSDGEWYEGRTGVAVLNAADGSLIRYSSLELSSVLSTIVYDIDNDGNPEVIGSGDRGDANNYMTVFDLITWEKEFEVSLTEGARSQPGIGDVTGDGTMEIIVPDETAGGLVRIYTYNPSTETYEHLTDLSLAGSGEPVYPTVIDVDNDGLNELIVSRYSGHVSVFDTDAPALDPGPRGDYTHFNEYRLGAPEYVSFIGLKNEQPSRNSTDQPLNPTLSINVVNYQDMLMDIAFYQKNGDNWNVIKTYTNVGDGTYSAVPTAMNQYETEYEWRVYVTDGYGGYQEGRYRLTTGKVTTEYPIVSDESPQDGTINVELNPTLSIDVEDQQSDLMDITFETDATGSWQVIKTYTNVENGTYTAIPTNMDQYGTTYNWRVIANDGNGHVTTETYSFTTEISLELWKYRKKIVVNKQDGGDNCRLYGAISNNLPNGLLQDHLIDEPNSLKNLAATTHIDGWGIGYYPNFGGSATIERGAERAYTDDDYDTVVSQINSAEPKVTLAHIRNCVGGCCDHGGETIDDPHPFVRTKNGKSWTFIHNGVVNVNLAKSLVGQDYLDDNPLNCSGVCEQNQNCDSEVFFLLLLKHIEENGWHISNGLVEAINELIDAGEDGGLNFILSDGVKMWAFRRQSAPHHTLYYLYNGSTRYAAVASEYPSASQGNWVAIDDYELVVFTSGKEPEIIDVTNYDPVEELVDFPVLIDITDPDLALKAQPDGDDILFTDLNLMKLDHEIELYESGSGHLVAWVRIPSIFCNQEQEIYMYYGNENAEKQQHSPGVWDANYVMVHHLEELSGDVLDSTSYEHEGIPQNGVLQDAYGKIDGADGFDGSNDYISINDDGDLDGNGTWSALTMEAWVKSGTDNQAATIAIGKREDANSGSYQIGFDSQGNSQIFCGYYLDTGYKETSYVDSPILTTDGWYHLVCTYETGDGIKLYINGQLEATNPSVTGYIHNTDIALYLGARGNEGTPHRFLNGDLDEVRISNIARTSDCWISKTYENQNDPSNFIQVEPEETTSDIVISNEYPHDGAIDVELNPTLSIDVVHGQSLPMNITFETNASGLWQVIKTYTGVDNGTYTAVTTNMNQYTILYHWRVTADDGVEPLIRNLSFTSLSEGNQPPTHDNPQLTSELGHNTTDEDLICTAQNVSDPNGDEVYLTYNWYRNGTSLANLVMPFNTENSSTAQDYSGYDNDGTINGATWTSSGIIGGAYSFDGTDDYIAIPDDATLDGNGSWSEMTMEAWVKADANQTRTIILAKWGPSGSRSYELGIDSNGNTQLFAAVDNGAFLETLYTDVAPLVPGTWYHVAATYKEGVVDLYINGALDATRSNAGGTIASSTDSLKIGARNPTPERFFNGTIDEVKIYPFALAAAQINQNYLQSKDGLSSEAKVVAEETEVGDEWQCRATPSDLMEDGITKQSNTLTIIVPGCITHGDCGFCEKCEAGSCQYQTAMEDLKEECPDDTCVTGYCDGAGACGLEPNTTLCRTSQGICDVAEYCTGASVSCPGDAFQPPSTVCRTSAGVCDVAENCTGSSASCPGDAFQPPSTVCRTSAGVCDVAENCTGSSASCPGDAFQPPSTVCRTSAGVCDVAENCTGSAAACPSDAKSTDVCRPSQGVCDIAESCNGSNNACPADAFETPTTLCRASAGVCDVAEYCPGNSASCPDDGYQPDGTLCDDELYCTQIDECTNGECIGKSDPCTDNGEYCDGVEYCEENTGSYICSSTGDPCGELACNEPDDKCDDSDVMLIIADAYGHSGTIDIELDNCCNLVSEVHVNVCDIDQRNWLHISTDSCSTTSRTSGFICGISDLGNGCIRVALTSPGFDLINPGETGAIAQLSYTLDATTPLGEFADLNPANIAIKDNGSPPESLSVTPKPGKVGAVGTDSDSDGFPDHLDNCPDIPNAPLLGTCLKIYGGGYFKSTGIICTNEEACGENEICDTYQLDCNENGIGDACEIDSDGDAVPDGDDNCPGLPNGPTLGTCICGGNSCMSDGACEYGSCSMNQEDTNNDDVGDACDQSLCRAYLCRYENCIALQASGRSVDYSACKALTNQGEDVCEGEAARCYWNPQGLPNGACIVDLCLSNADFNSAIDGLDLAVYKKELFRVDCPYDIGGGDLCEKYSYLYNYCVDLYSVGRNVDYGACKALTNQGESVCKAAGCYWNPQGLPNGACIVDLCLSNADFNSAIDGLDLAVYKKELFRVDCP